MRVYFVQFLILNPLKISLATQDVYPEIVDEKMSPEALLNCRRLPGRLNAEEAAVLIGCCSHDIPILIRSGLIRPLGSPAPNSVKYFSSSDLEKKLSDEKWGTRVTNALYRHWQDQRRKRASSK